MLHMRIFKTWTMSIIHAIRVDRYMGAKWEKSIIVYFNTYERNAKPVLYFNKESNANPLNYKELNS